MPHTPSLCGSIPRTWKRTCLTLVSFHCFGTEEKGWIHVNLDLTIEHVAQPNGYAYQGEGGSRVAYLDGRKVAEDQAEDTFGAYPPLRDDWVLTGWVCGECEWGITFGATQI